MKSFASPAGKLSRRSLIRGSAAALATAAVPLSLIPVKPPVHRVADPLTLTLVEHDHDLVVVGRIAEMVPDAEKRFQVIGSAGAARMAATYREDLAIVTERALRSGARLLDLMRTEGVASIRLHDAVYRDDGDGLTITG